MNEVKIRQKINHLYSLCSMQEGKYVRNISRYMWNGVRRDDLWNPRTAAQVYQSPAKATDGIQTQVNVIKSVVDTITSKITQAATRPHFNTVNGDYDSRKIAKDLQRHFDIWFDEQHALPKSTLCFRDAAVTGIGVMHVNAESKGLEVAHPWEYQIDPVEYATGAITHCQWYRKYVPLAKLLTQLDNKKLKDTLDDDPQTQGQYTIYWDLYGGIKYELFDGEFIHDGIPLEYEQYGGLYRRPFVEIFYTKPMKGYFSSCLVDDVFSLQKQVDALVARMDTATRNAVLGMILTDGLSGGLKASNIANGYQVYDCSTEKPPVFIAPQAINNQFIELFKMYVDEIYNMAGVPKLDAQAKAPSNLDSGKALDTMEDIASDRFNTQLQQYTHFLVDCARVAIDCFPPKDNIIDKKTGGNISTWGDARKARDKYQLQETTASILSKDPQEKMNQILALEQMGKIDEDMASDLMQLPDLENAYSNSGASYEHCQRIIQHVIENEDYDYAETVDLEMLLKESVKMLNIMHANGDNEKYIDRVKELVKKVSDDITALGKYNQAPPEQAPFEPLREFALDAGQISQLVAMAQSVKAGALDVQSAIEIGVAAFPKIPVESLGKIFTTPTMPGTPMQASAPAPATNIMQGAA